MPAYSVTTSSETVVVSDVKEHLNLETTEDNTLVGLYITAARQAAEAYTKLDLVPKSVVMYLNDFPSGDAPIELRDHAPLQSVTSIAYLDEDGTSQELSTGDFNYDIYAEPPRIYPDYSTSWPQVYDYPNAHDNVRVTYLSGYTTATLPAQATHAIKIIVADMYEQRESGIVGTVSAKAKVMLTAERLLAQIQSPVV